MEDLTDPQIVLHWYDFSCPRSYIGQTRSALLTAHGRRVVMLPLQINRDLPSEGLRIEGRSGPKFMALTQEAKANGLRLNWSAHMPNTRGALACAEWVRRNRPDVFPQFHEALFDAHFVAGENIGAPAIIFRIASELGIDVAGLQAALADGSAGAALRESEALARQSKVTATPVWIIDGEAVTALLPAEEFERLAGQGAGTNRTA